MGIIWTLLVIAVIAFNVDYYYNRELGSATGTTFLILIASAIVLVLIAAVSSGFPKDVTTKLWYTKNIHLKDAGTTYEGSFVLGSGSIDNTAYYTAYIHTSDGFYKEKFDQKITYIKETDSVAPKVEKYMKITTRNWLESWLLGKEIFNGCCYTKIILYVPRGTIIKKFRLE